MLAKTVNEFNLYEKAARESGLFYSFILLLNIRIRRISSKGGQVQSFGKVNIML
jgi:hypothetical protein